MLQPTGIDEQLAAVRDDPLRVLVVGAGVAGITVVGLLRRQGLHPVLLERAGPDADSGYMIALMPLVDPVLDALAVTDEYVTNSIRLRRYRMRNRRGATIREYSMGDLLHQYGDYRGISRADLLQVLGSRGGTVTHRATVTALDQDTRSVRATIHDGTTSVSAGFDLVIAADGLRSTTRALALPADQVAEYDTGWGGWVTWTTLDGDSDLGEELWGNGMFAGSYPVKDQLGIIMGGPRTDTKVGAEAFVARARRLLRQRGPRLDRLLDTVAGTDDAYYWSLTDCRCATWSNGRVLMLGDAAAGFLPTAGIGAGMAMESAWVLAATLDGITGDELPKRLQEYERQQRPRVEAAQDNSRKLATLMFRRGAVLAAVRDIAARFIPLEAALGPIRDLLRSQPRV